VPAEIKLVVGLGNPGREYSRTRHNAGFWFVDRLVDSFHGNFSPAAGLLCDIARLQADGIDCRLIKPQTHMNESGRSVILAMNYYRIAPQQMLVVHDEIDFPPGIIRLKLGGGHAGHNGLRSIIKHIGSNDFARIRIGVGHPGDKDRVVGSVLSRPTAAEQKLIDDAIEQGLDNINLVLTGELEKAMTALHTVEQDKQ
jgi:PTH1 family peptidyl-tRNA hydrolase